LTVNLTVKFSERSVSEFYRQTGFRNAQKPTNYRVSATQDRAAWEIIEFFASCRSVDTRLIQCSHLHQQTPITGATPFIDDSPEVTGAFRGYLLLSVTEVHVGYVYTESG
jgi:hypothetical protein